MIRSIVKDNKSLAIPSTDVVIKNNITLISIIQDLLDTANHHKQQCAGLAGVQIGYNKRICVIYNSAKGGSWLPMINPKIIKTYGEKFQSPEGCVSTDEIRYVERYPAIEVTYTDMLLNEVTVGLRMLPALAVQHVIDHMNGIII